MGCSAGFSYQARRVRREVRYSFDVADKSMKTGGGGKFSALASKLAKKGVDDPKALAASIGRKKYGKEKFQQLAAEGRRRAS